ncbi:MAG TPA: hypothetical protein LFW13_02295 [Rickettsia endosymbiont of Sericostoma sp.]|uniref:hypothetical protein n=1 Tax=Candidatus Tisiphia endosymbiont of Nemotelus uliginosus TaxID=3077926 RepID=UPI001D6C7F96|nr:hypothetical protein [Rickettsia endosymbiont of Sericostoma sp.]
MEFNRNKAIIGFLRANEEQKFTPIQIAEWLVKTYPEEVKKKAERSKNETLNNITDSSGKDKMMLGILSGEMHKNWFKSIQNQEPNIKKEDYPLRYYYTKETEQVEREYTEKEPNIKEKEIYPKLSDFLLQELGVHSKIINDKCSSNYKGTNGNKWLHPDLVGMEDLTKDWALAIKDCVQQFADKKAKLWSFEVKVVIDSANVRQSFFQALSNSSWANYGYLVASSLVEGKGGSTLRELEILAARHGIGFILLNIKDQVEKGRILIPAKERLEIDWDMANRLVKENKGFESFIGEVRDFCMTGKTRLS